MNPLTLTQSNIDLLFNNQPQVPKESEIPRENFSNEFTFKTDHFSLKLPQLLKKNPIIAQRILQLYNKLLFKIQPSFIYHLL